MGQTVSFGLRAGAPVTAQLRADQGYQASTQRYTIGPALEVGLFGGWAVGADFLLQAATLATPGSARATVRRWQLPVTLGYRFGGVAARPFVRGGPAFNRVFDTGTATPCAHGPFGEQFYCLDGNTLAELRHRGTHGAVIGGGFELRCGRVHFVPEVRATRWIDRNFGTRSSSLRSNLTEIEILVGLMF